MTKARKAPSEPSMAAQQWSQAAEEVFAALLKAQ